MNYFMPKSSAPSSEERADANTGSKGIQSVEIGGQVLEVLIKAAGPLSLKALSAAAGMSPPKVHRYLASFIRAGLVYQDPATGRYDLGNTALRLGLAALNRLDSIALATQGLKRLVATADQTGMLAVWGEHGPTIISWQRGSQPLVTNLALGSVLPVLSSATARVFLAFMPRAMMRRIIEREIEASSTKQGAFYDLEKLEWLIVETRKERLARVEGGVIPGLRAASAPIFDFQSETVAAITLLGSMAAPTAPFEAAVEEMSKITAEVSAQLGWAGS
jgi:DNA-binding IclR family transcriptional regulator